MCVVFNRFSKLWSIKTKEKEAKRANGLKLLKAIHEIDDKYILTYKKIRALEKQNE